MGNWTQNGVCCDLSGARPDVTWLSFNSPIHLQSKEGVEGAHIHVLLPLPLGKRALKLQLPSGWTSNSPFPPPQLTQWNGAETAKNCLGKWSGTPWLHALLVKAVPPLIPLYGWMDSLMQRKIPASVPSSLVPSSSFPVCLSKEQAGPGWPDVWT